MKKLVILSVCLWALGSTPVLAQTERPAAVVVQLYTTGLVTQNIAITRGAGQTEEMEFKASAQKDHALAEAYQRVIAKLYQEGYTLKSTFEVYNTQTVTLVFEKR